KAALDHDLVQGENILTLNLGGAMTATDFDGDTIPLSDDAIVVTAIDDVPLDFDPDASFVRNSGDELLMGFNLEFDEVAGQDGPKSTDAVVFDSAIDGNQLFDKDGAAVTSGGDPVYLNLDAEGDKLFAMAQRTITGTAVTPATLLTESVTITLGDDEVTASAGAEINSILGTHGDLVIGIDGDGNLYIQSIDPDDASLVVSGLTDFGISDDTYDVFETVFTIELTETDTYNVQTFLPLDDGTTRASIDIFDNAENPGKYLFNLLDNVEVGSVTLDVLVSGSDGPGSIIASNISQQGTGVASQGVGEDESIIFDFGVNFTRSNIGPNTGSFWSSGPVALNDASIEISQTNPDGQGAVIQLEASNPDFNFTSSAPFTHTDSTEIDEYLGTDADRVAITKVFLNPVADEFYALTDYASGTSLDGGAHYIYYEVDPGDGLVYSVYITGVIEGDVIGIGSDETFTRLTATNGSDDTVPGGGTDTEFGGTTFSDGDYANTFDISDLAFQIDGQQGDPIEMAFPVIGEDADGDQSNGVIDLTILPADTNNIVGTNGNDTLPGTESDDFVVGNAGNDTLTGDLGNDTLIGGTGADEFVFLTDNDGVDQILDFESGIDDLLFIDAGFGGVLFGISSDEFISGAGVDDTSAAGDHLLFNTSNGYLYFDADGSSGGAILIATITGDDVVFTDIIIA
ncbi:calcium-binding protein, partial [Silicimonas sp. MF1-12-2]|uniref:calcium-binding protein n=1 Tax=Silicimonas sp. MF1-12-2 TaxID=3384793 RepID=UPI0039B62F48